jgi:hypothetical protein
MNKCRPQAAPSEKSTPKSGVGTKIRKNHQKYAVFRSFLTANVVWEPFEIEKIGKRMFSAEK